MIEGWTRASGSLGSGVAMLDVLLIVVVLLLVFGSKKLRTVGSDLGAAVKGFRKAVTAPAAAAAPKPREQQPDAEFPEVTAREQSERRERP
ncbi:MAG TPA: twin-arginine translocase TatA/TatE family subunit [Steroidobacteraceae bacterium]|nr:twin-arginine translocase TatA/TatE family subunit [Steroidobacteraceae bacterium]